MPTNIDYREIVQTVTQQVTTDITNRLNTIKPAIQNEIAEAVRNSLNQALQPQLDSICSRLDAIEQLVANPTPTGLLNQINDLQKRLAKVEQLPVPKGGNNPSSVPVHNTPSVTVPVSRNTSRSKPQVGADPDGSTLLTLMQNENWPRFYHNGWIFYTNKMDNYPYMIREDGTGNTKIYYCSGQDEFISVTEIGRDWLVKYKDHYSGDIKSFVVKMK